MFQCRKNHSDVRLAAIILIGMFLILPRTSYGNESESEIPINPDGLVVVEPTFTEYSRTEGQYKLVPFRERRGTWGNQFSVGYAQYTPVDYTSSFSAFSYEEAYGYEPDLPLIELQYTFKRNFMWGSLGIETGVGMYQNSSAVDAIDSDLQLIPIRLGATLILDGLTRFPYLAPYGSVGAYTMMFEETMEGENTFSGNTQVAPYFSFGAQINLDWVDPIASRQGFEENGIQATFLYVEGRSFLESGAAKDPSFANGIEPNAGVRVEF